MTLRRWIRSSIPCEAPCEAPWEGIPAGRKAQPGPNRPAKPDRPTRPKGQPKPTGQLSTSASRPQTPGASLSRRCYTRAIDVAHVCYNKSTFVAWVCHSTDRVSPMLHSNRALWRIHAPLSAIAGRRSSRMYRRCDNSRSDPVAPTLHSADRTKICRMGVPPASKEVVHGCYSFAC